ncbi:MAG TPA: hypothetical protein VI732_05465 [Alphaproteobacteria bacterium]|jgi:hypothetical protein|nr:hypothetical protein [Alphaproteobacteria bacterium]
MRSTRALAAAIAMSVLWAGPSLAADPPSPDESLEKQRRATDLAIEATQMLMRALNLMIEALPQYGPPRIDGQGNIVIPRIHKDSAPQDKTPGRDAPDKPERGTPL